MTASASLEKRAKKLLAQSPGLKARELAKHLDAEKRDVNSLLYGNLAHLVHQDAQYRWYLIEDAPKEAGEEEEIPDTPLAGICRYYLECLTHGDSEGVSVFATSKYDLDYLEIPEWPFGQEAPRPFASQEAKKLLAKVRKDRFEKTLYLGYPVFLRAHRARRGGEYFFVEPVFLFTCEFDPENRFGLPTLQGDVPFFNLKALEHLPLKVGERAVQESIQLTEELGLDRATVDPEEFDDVSHRLRAKRQEWPWIEDADPHNLTQEPPLSEASRPGLYNRAVLVMAERSKYTLGLETELNKLMKLEPDDYRDTALGQWLHETKFSSPPSPNEPLLEVLPLNTEQRAAVQQGLVNELTVVTGPPGTGKSQVVTSLLVNSAWQGKKVLFASKNNKAVDVVEERVNSLGPRPILLRLGKNEYQEKLADYLTSLLSARAGPSDKKRYQESREKLDTIRARHETLEDQIKNLVNLRNQTDQLEQQAEDAREFFGDDYFRSIGGLDLEALRSALEQLKISTRGATRAQQPFINRVLWFLIKRVRYRALAHTADQISEHLGTLRVSAPAADPSDETIESWHKLLQRAEERLALVQNAKRYLSSLQTLSQNDPLEKLQRRQAELVGDMSSVSRTVWDHWLALQPERLSQSDRRLLGDYTSQIKHMISSSKGKGIKKAYRRYYELFPSVSRFLPCWAVTNLTARRIPFQQQFFDFVVIDEASQCDIASALPLLFRAKRAVIIGDPQQLRHITGITEAQDQALLEKHDLVERSSLWSYRVNSLYDLSSFLCRSEDIVVLRDHHRSHADIITFSNEYFYEGNLRIATRYENLELLDSHPSVRWEHVSGSTKRPSGGGAINEREADAVVEEIRRLLLDARYPGTLGVVTPFRAQANRIRDLVNRDENLTRALAGREFIPDTAHGFQGDERDLILFSPVVASNMPRGALWFLNHTSNLFNVAITRARAALVVVGNQDAARQCGVEYLEKFVDYAHQLQNSRKREATSDINLDSLGPEYPVVAHPDRVSDWERLFYKALYEAGIKTIPQYNVEKYALDLALLDDDRKLDIEVDGEKYHRRWDGELVRRDQLRNFRLMELGWDVMRFWVYQIRDDLRNSVERVKRWVEKGD